MTSWKLFAHIIAAWRGYSHPVFLREMNHRPVWYGTTHRIAHSESLRTGVLTASTLVWIVAVLYVNNLLMLVLLPMLLLAVLTSITLGPIVVEERIKQSWEPLLTTPPGVEWVLLGKAGGALWWLRYLVRTVAVLLLPLVAGVGFVSLVLIPRAIVRTEGSTQLVLCGFMVALPVAGGLLFLVERAQQYVLLVAAALAASATSRSIPRALSAATTSVLLVWLSEVLLVETLLITLSDRMLVLSKPHLLLTATMGPIVGYMLELDLRHAVPYIIGTLLVREVVIYGLWQWTLHHARGR